MAVLSKRAWWFWPWCVGCFILFIQAMRPDQLYRPWYIACFFAGLIGLYIAANAHEKRVAIRQAALDGELIESMLVKVRAGQDVTITSYRFIYYGLSLILLGSSLTVFRVGTIGAIVLGSIFFLLFSLVSLDVLKTMSGPALTVSYAGFACGIGCQIPWADVEGVYLEKVTYRGMVGHRLHFRIPRLVNRIPEMNWAACIYYRIVLKYLRGSRLTIDMDHPNESPQLVRDLVLALWGNKTGRKYLWHPGMSEAMYANLLEADTLSRDIIASDPTDIVGLQRHARHAAELSRVLQREALQVNHWKNGGKIPNWVAVLVVTLVLTGLAVMFAMA